MAARTAPGARGLSEPTATRIADMDADDSRGVGSDRRRVDRVRGRGRDVPSPARARELVGHAACQQNHVVELHDSADVDASAVMGVFTNDLKVGERRPRRSSEAERQRQGGGCDGTKGVVRCDRAKIRGREPQGDRHGRWQKMTSRRRVRRAPTHAAMSSRRPEGEPRGGQDGARHLLARRGAATASSWCPNGSASPRA